MSQCFWFHRVTPSGEGGVAVFELYGVAAPRALATVFRGRAVGLPEPGRLRLGELVDREGKLVDEVVLGSVAPEAAWTRLRTYTVSLHGSPWLETRTASLLRELGGVDLDLHGALALAVREGALDGTQATAYHLLVQAKTEPAALFLSRQYQGELAAALRQAMDATQRGQLTEARALLQALLRHALAARRLHEPLRVLIAGQPNTGKSTLYNRLLDCERAVVAPQAGTTRDLLEDFTVIEGFPVLLGDSAGLRFLGATRSDLAAPDVVDAVDAVERAGIELALRHQVDAWLYLLPPPWQLSQVDRAFLEGKPGDQVQILDSLSDLEPTLAARLDDLRISPLTGAGIEALKQAVRTRWLDPEGFLAAHAPVSVFTARQARAVERAILGLENESTRHLDDVHSAYVECLSFSPTP